MIIHTSGLSKRYGGVTALDGLDLDVAAGELYAFLGPNGAGKSTTIRILNGLSRADGGRAVLGGLDLARHGAEAKRLCGMAAQNINLDGELTVAENLEFHGRLYNLARAERRRRAAELLAYVELADRAASPVKTLSGGLKRRVMLARAMMHQPRILFLDEPTAGLDPAIRRRIWSLVKKVRADGVTVFLTTHYIEEAAALASRVGFLHRGRLVAEGEPEEFTARLGAWAVDRYRDGDLASAYFTTREEAARSMSGDGDVVLRRTNLEDVFLSLTGDRVL